jgi:D-glycero-D-manno-heptose 1,7-bisphosphate phosphatase
VIGDRIAVFLDRDGTVVEEEGFLCRAEDVRLIPGAGKALHRLNSRGILVCIVTNQSGIARGFFSEADLEPIHARMLADLRKDGAWIDRIVWCPHHPTEGLPPYKADCECRKPRPGMIFRLADAFGVDPARSFVIGDRVSDVELGNGVGAQSVLVLTGYGNTALTEATRAGVKIDHVAPSIVEAVDFVIQQIEGVTQTHA